MRYVKSSILAIILAFHAASLLHEAAAEASGSRQGTSS